MVLIFSLLHSSVVAFTVTTYNIKGYTVSLQSLRCKTSLYESSSFDENFVDMQKRVGENETKTTSIESHLRHQQEVFDEMSGFFNSEEAIPEEVKPVLRFLAKKTLSDMKTNRENEDGKYDILDVGCGTGALFPYYLEAANDLGITLNVFGLDLSSKMIEYAKENGRNIISISENTEHSIQCKTGDFVECVMGVNCCNKTLTGFDDGVLDESTERFRDNFDAVVINACFGNFLDPGEFTGMHYIFSSCTECTVLADDLMIENVTYLHRFRCYSSSKIPEIWRLVRHQSSSRISIR